MLEKSKNLRPEWLLNRLWYVRFTNWTFDLFGIFICLKVLMPQSGDKMKMLLATIAIFISLGSIAFSFARSLNSEIDYRDSVIFAGERFMHTAILLALSIYLQYMAQWLPETAFLAKHLWATIPKVILALILSAIAVWFALYAMLSARAAVRVLNELLFRLYGRFPEYLSKP